MKQIRIFSKKMLGVCKYGLTAVTFFMGVLPVMAQEEVEATADDQPNPVTQVSKKQKTYPMVEISGTVYDVAEDTTLAGVQIKAFNNSYYTAMTDSAGRYTIKVPNSS